MYAKTLIWLGLFVGSTIGGMFSFSSVLLIAVGGILGIWAGAKLSNYVG